MTLATSNRLRRWGEKDAPVPAGPLASARPAGAVQPQSPRPAHTTPAATLTTSHGLRREGEKDAAAPAGPRAPPAPARPAAAGSTAQPAHFSHPPQTNSSMMHTCRLHTYGILVSLACIVELRSRGNGMGRRWRHKNRPYEPDRTHTQHTNDATR